MVYEETYEAVREVIFGRAFSHLAHGALLSPLTPTAFNRWPKTDARYLSGVWTISENPGRPTTVTHFCFLWRYVVRNLKRIYTRYETAYADTPEYAGFWSVVNASPEGERVLADELESVFTYSVPAAAQVIPDPIQGLSERLTERLYDDPVLKGAYFPSMFTLVRLPYSRMKVSRTSESLGVLLQRCEPLSPNALLNLHSQLFWYCPRVIHLLYLALQHSRADTAGNAFAKWGLIWQPSYLLFNIRTAYDALVETGELSAQMDDLTFEDLVSDPTRPAKFQTMRLRGLPGFTKIGTPLQKISGVQQNLIEWAAYNTRPDFNPKNYYRFGVDSDVNVFTYFKTLQSLTEKHAEKLTSGELVKVEGIASPKKRRKYQHPIRVTVNAVTLGFFPDPTRCKNVFYVPMTVSLYTHANKQYITYPHEYVEVDASVNQLSDALRKGRELFYEVTRLAESGDLRGQYVFDITPQTTSASKERAQYLRAFHTLCQWLVDPTHDDCAQIAGTYFDRISPWRVSEYAEQYPLPLTTLDERVDFLRAKSSATKLPVVYNQTKRIPRSDGKDKRSARRSSYDDFVFWYVEKYGFYEAFPRASISDDEYAKFICYHWMRWRRPRATVDYVHASGFTGNVATADELLNEHSLQSDYPFTRDQPGSGSKVTQFVYEEHMPKAPK